MVSMKSGWRFWIWFAAGLISLAILIVFPAMRSPAEQASVPARKISAEALRLNTLGVAFMNQGKSAEAQKYFEQALAKDTNFAEARLNLGIALLAQQKADQASAALEEATKKVPDDPYAWYNLGLAYKDLTQPEKAIPAFQHVEKLAPDEPDAFYFEGFLYAQLQKYDDAITAFKKALAIAPYHASAQFGLARAYQRKGDTEAAREGMKRFQKVTFEHLGTPFGAAYGDQGKFSLAEFVRGADSAAPAEIPVHYAAKALTDGMGASTGVCVFDYDGDGKSDIFLVGGEEKKSRLLRNLGGGKFEDVTTKAGLAGIGAGMGCAAGDFDNDGATDLAVCQVDGVRLFRNDGKGKFEEVTEKAGIVREKGCVATTFVDYDHDGDLDLYVTISPANGPKNKLWRNNGNSTFTDVSEESGLGVSATGADVAVTDFNNDRAIDLVIAGGASGAAVLLNPREGKFTAMPGIDFAKEKLPPAVGVAVFDFNKDGWMDIAFTHAGAPGISLWRNVDGKKVERVALPDFGWRQGWGVTCVAESW
jgi:tetratricopeptide (TPR) repeat protein